MKNKTARSLVQAFDSILSKKRKPEKLRRDKGTEFVNESFQQYLKKQGIQFYTATKRTLGRCGRKGESYTKI